VPGLQVRENPSISVLGDHRASEVIVQADAGDVLAEVEIVRVAMEAAIKITVHEKLGTG